jgi:secreted trypsin-like serine protease
MKGLLLLIICQQVAGFEDRIVGGPNAEIDRFPYMASMHRIKNKALICSGAIIHVKWILTAAHCQKPVSEFRVRVGSSFVSYKGDVYDAAEFILHPKYYNLTTYWVDIALIRLATPIKLSRTVQTIRLAKHSAKFPAGTGCEFSGYGKTMVPSDDAKEWRLRYLGMPILPKADCEMNVNFKDRTMLCVGFKNVPAGTCFVSFYCNWFGTCFFFLKNMIFTG